MNYNNKKFKPVKTPNNAEVNESTIFHYKQEGKIITCTYAGGEILKGHFIGTVDKKGNIDLRYHQINKEGILNTGICFSTPEIMSNGKIRLHENWEWTSGDKSKGVSIIEEV